MMTMTLEYGLSLYQSSFMMKTIKKSFDYKQSYFKSKLQIVQSALVLKSLQLEQCERNCDHSVVVSSISSISRLIRCNLELQSREHQVQSLETRNQQVAAGIVQHQLASIDYWSRKDHSSLAHQNSMTSCFWQEN